MPKRPNVGRDNEISGFERSGNRPDRHAVLDRKRKDGVDKRSQAHSVSEEGASNIISVRLSKSRHDCGDGFWVLHSACLVEP